MAASAGLDRDSAAYDASESYTKYEFRIPMRDGVRLFTSVLVPKDTTTTYPFMLTRSPFGVTRTVPMSCLRTAARPRRS